MKNKSWELTIFNQFYQGGVEMIRRDLLTGHWRPYLERAITLKPCYEGGSNGGEVSSSFSVIVDHLIINGCILNKVRIYKF